MLIKHDIKTTMDQPIKQKAKRFPINQKEETKAQMEEMLKDGIIEPSFSP